MKLVKFFAPAGWLGAVGDKRQQARGTAGGLFPFCPGAGTLGGGGLAPCDRMNEARRAKKIGTENLLDEYADGPLEGVQRIVQSYNRALGQEGTKKVEVFLGAGVSVVTIDPQKSNRTVPVFGNVAGKCAMDLHVAFDVCGSDICQEF